MFPVFFVSALKNKRAGCSMTFIDNAAHAVAAALKPVQTIESDLIKP
tara:strand:- start:542 stop:682 length:141 start_codon:yes stop_codon:yes gene_type:complete